MAAMVLSLRKLVAISLPAGVAVRLHDTCQAHNNSACSQTFPVSKCNLETNPGLQVTLAHSVVGGAACYELQ